MKPRLTLIALLLLKAIYLTQIKLSADKFPSFKHFYAALELSLKWFMASAKTSKVI